jgi:hypothetical protein
MRIISSFDHTYDRIESRANASYGVEVYENQVNPDGVYEELSFLRFYDVQSLENNGRGVQWEQAGGDNCEFWIKASEGSVGIRFSRNDFSNIIHSQFFDDPGAGAGVAIETASDFVNDLVVENVYGYANLYNVQVTRGARIWIRHSFQNSNVHGHVDVRVSPQRARVYLEEQDVTYIDDNTHSVVGPASAAH